MSYKVESTRWKLTAPQAGEVDSVENVTDTLKELDAAMLSPGEKEQLLSKGNDIAIVTDSSSEFYDSTYTYDDYKKTYVTNLHEHPIPDKVPLADNATHAEFSELAETSNSAKKLNPGGSINGHKFTGVEDLTITNNDIPDSIRVFYGTQHPNQFAGFPTELREGDLYVKIIE